MSIRLKDNKRRAFSSLIILIVIVAFMIYIILSRFVFKEVALPLTKLIEKSPATESLPTEFETDFLDKKFHYGLERSADLPVEVSEAEIGRQNPFEFVE